MKKELKYRINNEPCDFRDIIRKAKEYGYTGEILQSSVAADYLRRNGHIVDDNPDYISESEKKEK